MDTLLYYLASGLIGLLQLFPLDFVARVGMFLGWVAYHLDARHRKVATNNMTLCLGKEIPPEKIKELVRENFLRIGEAFACAAKTVSMKRSLLNERIEIVGSSKLESYCHANPPSSVVLAVGHFANFEVLAMANRAIPNHQIATTYRAIRPASINRLLLRLRQKTGGLYFERRTEGSALRDAVRANNIILGFLSDQHSGEHGVRIPFLGHDCNTTKAPAVYALRFNIPLFVAVCYRTKLAHWLIEVSPEIPTFHNGEPRSVEEVMTDVNRFFESAVRRDPANWFWVHKRWKGSKIKGSPAKKSVASPGLNELDPAAPQNADL